MGERSTADEQYWKDYDGLQAVKHRILARYLDAWFAILSKIKGQLLYLDCHAGRGRHTSGDAGSPILVLEKLLGHQHRRRILKRVSIACHFFERNDANANQLRHEIARVGPLPSRISTHVHPTDYEAALSQLLDRLERTGTELPPSFAFIDPYGFTLSMHFMNRILKAGRTETLINFMYRYVDMGLHVPDKSTILDDLFGTSEWRSLTSIDDYKKRFEATVKLFCDQLDAEHVSWVVMRGDSDAIKYVLVHATNSLKGWRIMKRAMWRELPDGSFTAYERDRPEQGVLISVTRSPDREAIELLETHFGGKIVSLKNDVHPVVDASLCLRKHVHEILRRATDRGIVRNLNEPGRFTAARNPRLDIPASLPETLANEDVVDQRDLFA